MGPFDVRTFCNSIAYCFVHIVQEKEQRIKENQQKKQLEEMRKQQEQKRREAEREQNRK